MVLFIFFSFFPFFFLPSLSWEIWLRAPFCILRLCSGPNCLFFFFFQFILCKSYGEVSCTISNKEQASKSLIKTINHQSNLILPLATTELSQFPPPSQWLFSRRLRTDFVQRKQAGAGTSLCCLLCECSCSLAKDFPRPYVPERESLYFMSHLSKPLTSNGTCPFWVFSFSLYLYLSMLGPWHSAVRSVCPSLGLALVWHL